MEDEVKDATAAVMSAFEEYKTSLDGRVAGIETALRRTGSPVDREQKAEMTAEQKAFNGFLRRGAEALPELERKALTVGDDTSGGYLAPGEFDREIVKNLVEFSPIRLAARVGSMTAGEIIIPRRTGRPTARWVGETEARTATQAAYGQVTITAHEMACYVDVSIKLLEDAAISVESEVSMDLGEEFGRLEGESFVTGDGLKKPVGLLSDATVAEVASGAAAAVTADGLIGVLYDLPAFYRNRSAWLMNGTTLAACRKLKSGDGQYLWQPGLAAGQPETLLGRPVVESVDMPDIAAGAFPVAVGDFKSAYRIYDRTGMSILRDPFTLATEGLVRFHGRRRVGADVVKAEALRKLKVAAA